MGRLAYPLNATLDRIADGFVLLKGLTVHTGEIACDPLGILDDVVMAVRRIVPRRQ